MTTVERGPKRRVSEKLPEDLVTFLSDVVAWIREGADTTTVPSDDLLQCRCAYGGLLEEGGDAYAFVYFPRAVAHPTRSRPRWEFELTRAQLELVGDGGMDSLPLWACLDPECGRRFWTQDTGCFDCDHPDRPRWRVPEGTFGSRQEWALAFFALNPTAGPGDVIGTCNGHTDQGEALGYFSFQEVQAVHQDHLSRSRQR